MVKKELPRGTEEEEG